MTDHDSTQPAKKKHKSAAERASAIVQDGARTLLTTEGLPGSTRCTTSACVTMRRKETRTAPR
eukprot:5115503-Pyramimonas_sp.AAC.2